ncbi:MAG: TRAP transporter TatT component family protein [Desulfobacteraceae bacterium]
MSLYKGETLFLRTEKTRKSLLAILVCLSVFLLNNCMRVALRVSPSLFPNFTTSIFEECDIELARNAIPANLKLLEGLLKNDPENKQILTTLSMGFGGYSMLFVEGDDPERASRLYLRSRDYGIRALGEKGVRLKDTQDRRQELQRVLQTLGKDELEPLFWITVSWNAWINLNLDKPGALAQLNASQALLDRVMEIDASYFNGLPHILMGVSLSARPPMLGGNVKQAKEHFDKALQLSHGKFFLAHYYFARYYAVRVQDKALFLRLTGDIEKMNPAELRDVCLINSVTQHKAKQLREMVDEFFL